ncbi:MAG TPA: hypothetical protein PKI03_11725 [Pseudomonadota bacterium]|nr:hypothetical protein [Pseudomonadota bacterium]
MDCADVQDELFAFHFAGGSQESRDRVHQHLRGCLACAASYLDLKHDIDSGAALEQPPSPACEARLRRDVAAWLLPPTALPVPSPSPDSVRQRRGTWAWLTQPMPRYRAMAAAAALCIVAVTAVSRLRPIAPAEGTAPGLELAPLPVRAFEPERVPGMPSPACEFDSARIQALSITYY